MPTLLTVLASPRGDYSISRNLTASFVEEWQKAHAGGEVVTRDLTASNLPFVDLPWIAGAYTPPEQHSPEMAAAIKVSDDLVAELLASDHIVIGTPMYNFSIPANLKAWIDHIVRVGKTFTSSYEGLVKGKKATVILASSGDYAPGSPAEGYNEASRYLTQILGFIGITDVHFVLAGSTSGVDQGKISREELLAKYTPEAVAAAR
jgi:FMN-dependent NADH-azoreductase